MSKRSDRNVIDAGFHIAEGLMKNAVQDAENEDEMRDRLYALRVAAVHMLAIEAVNIEIQTEIKLEDWLADTFEAIREQVRMLKGLTDQGEIIHHKGFEQKAKPDPDNDTGLH